MMGELSGEAMYREHIMDHYNNPRNKGKVENPTLIHSDVNPLCGDAVSLSIKMENRKIKRIMFDGVGCAISMAASSILCEEVQEQTIQEVMTIDREHMLSLLGVVVTPARVKCGMLTLATLKDALKKYEEAAQ